MISIQTVITVVSALSSVGVVVGAILACHKWFLKQEKQDEDIAKMKEEKKLKKQITINIDSETIDYFKQLSESSGIPYQTLINLYLYVFHNYIIHII